MVRPSLEVNRQLELGRLFDRNLGKWSTLQHTGDLRAGHSEHVGCRAVACKTPGFGHFMEKTHGWQSSIDCRRGEDVNFLEKHSRGKDANRLGTGSVRATEGASDFVRPPCLNHLDSDPETSRCSLEWRDWLRQSSWWITQQGNALCRWHQLVQDCEALDVQLGGKIRGASQLATRPGKSGDQSILSSVRARYRPQHAKPRESLTGESKVGDWVIVASHQIAWVSHETVRRAIPAIAR
jgi:hypothetical protein